MNPSTTTRPIFRGSIAFQNAEEEIRKGCDALKDEAPTDATERIIALCRKAATSHDLTDDEFAFLLTFALLTWRENYQHSDLPSGWAVNVASFALACVPEGDPLKWLCEHASRLLTDGRDVLDNGGMVDAPDLPALFACYTEEGIWATGTTAETAIECFLDEARATHEEVGAIQTAPMTARLAERVERHGFDCTRDKFRVLSDGRLDIDA